MPMYLKNGLQELRIRFYNVSYALSSFAAFGGSTPEVSNMKCKNIKTYFKSSNLAFFKTNEQTKTCSLSSMP